MENSLPGSCPIASCLAFGVGNYKGLSRRDSIEILGYFLGQILDKEDGEANLDIMYL